MRLKWLCLLAFGLGTNAHLRRRDHENNDYFALHLKQGSSPSRIAERLGATFEGPLGELPDHYTFSSPKHRSDEVENILQAVRPLKSRARGTADHLQALRAKVQRREYGLEDILWSEKQFLRQRLVKRTIPQQNFARQFSSNGGENQATDEAQQAAIEKLNTIAATLDIKDPIFKEQWHLFNPIQLGHDLNVTGVWLEGITGNGTIAAIIDDGLDMYSNDLKPNYYAEGSWDFNEHSEEPRPRLSDDRHGTRCAGEIGAAKNDICGVGMAYDGRIAGIRILSKPISDEDEAASLNYHFQDNQIYSCSWGPPDDGQTMEGPGVLVQRAMVNGVQKGRNGLGSIFVFAAGNGGAAEDNCNFDGYTNSIYSITVGGIDRAGNHPSYSEACSAQMVVTYSSGHGDAIHTTDVGENKCYSGHSGTSAAGPLVVGAVALALSARPELTWRDLQYLCVQTAVPFHLDDGHWQTTTIGRKYSHQFGYGKMDTYSFVQLAKTWEPVKPQAWYNSPWISVQHNIPQGNQGLAASFDVTAEMLKKANFERLEHVTVTMNIEHERRGDLSVELKSPDGIISHLSTTRRNDNARAGYNDWTFMSVVHWGESGIGTWTIIVKDTPVNDYAGKFIDWRLNLWGESINAAVQTLHPLPDEHDDDHETATGIVVTTSINTAPLPSVTPTETHSVDRPTKPKPTNSQTATTTFGVPGTTTTSSAEPTHSYSDSFLPSFFPTFGVSKRTQVWIYGSIGLIVAFCIGLGVYFVMQRRKRQRTNPRDAYEFEMVGNEDEDEARRGLNGQASGKYGKGRPRRGGELYDAFAGESDEELYSDDDPYEDTPESGSGNSRPEGAGEKGKG